MTEYRRAHIEGATYFFTVICAERHGNDILTKNIDVLSESFRKVKDNNPVNLERSVGCGIIVQDIGFTVL